MSKKKGSWWNLADATAMGKALGISGEWKITFADARIKAANAVEGDGTAAQCESDTVYRIATVWRGPAWKNASHERQRLIVAHELAHIATSELASMARMAIDHAPKASRRALEFTRHQAAERLCETLASAVVALVPEPVAPVIVPRAEPAAEDPAA